MTVTVYPRVYQLSSRPKALWGAVYLTATLGGLASGICWLYDLELSQQLAITGMGAFFAIGAAFGLVFSLRAKLVLHKDHIEYHGVFALRRIRRDDILETCKVRTEYGTFYITLVLKSGRPKHVQICDFGVWDEAFEAFINEYPNVELEAEIADEETLSTAVDQNLVFGNTEDQRIENYNRWVTWANRLKWPAIAIAAWGAFYPEPYNAGLYAALMVPVACLLAVVIFHERLILTEDNTSGRVPVYVLASFSIYALLLRALSTSSSLIDWVVPAAVAVGTAFVFTGLIAVAERKMNWDMSWATLILCGIYAWSAGLVLNDILDDAKPRIEHVQVLRKETTGSDPDYDLHLAAWGTFDEQDYEVSQKVYDKAEVGQPVCIRIYPGWLGWENYYVRSCETGKPA